MDYYKILEVPKEADEEQIKQAYRRKAKKYHPDLNPGNPEAEARFKDIVEAYEVLGDAAKRREYDLKQEKTAGQAKTKKTAGSAAPDMDIANFTKNMEKYFGFSFNGEQSVANQSRQNTGTKKNPLDVTEMFEAYMKIK